MASIISFYLQLINSIFRKLPLIDFAVTEALRRPGPFTLVLIHFSPLLLHCSGKESINLLLFKLTRGPCHIRTPFFMFFTLFIKGAGLS